MLFPQDKLGEIYKEIACALASKYDLLMCRNELVSCGNDLLTYGNDLVSCGNDLLTCGNDLLSCGNVLLFRDKEIKKMIGKQFYVPSWAL